MKKFDLEPIYGKGAESRFMANMEFRAMDDTETVTGYGAVFGFYSENLGGFREIIEPGAFDDVLKDDVRALINHDPNMLLARTKSGTLTLSADGTGLKYSFDLPDTSYARDLKEQLARGDLDQSSFGFTVEVDEWSEGEDGIAIRTIKKIGRLFDVSPVTFPAYPDATVAIRSLSACEALEKAKQREHRERELQLLSC